MSEALLTRCPHCQSIFRVAPADLEPAYGAVRCGECAQIFNALNHQVEPDTLERLLQVHEAALSKQTLSAALPPEHDASSSTNEPATAQTPVSAPTDTPLNPAEPFNLRAILVRNAANESETASDTAPPIAPTADSPTELMAELPVTAAADVDAPHMPDVPDFAPPAAQQAAESMEPQAEVLTAPVPDDATQANAADEVLRPDAETASSLEAAEPPLSAVDADADAALEAALAHLEELEALDALLDETERPAEPVATMPPATPESPSKTVLSPDTAPPMQETRPQPAAHAPAAAPIDYTSRLDDAPLPVTETPIPNAALDTDAEEPLAHAADEHLTPITATADEPPLSALREPSDSPADTLPLRPDEPASTAPRRTGGTPSVLRRRRALTVLLIGSAILVTGWLARDTLAHHSALRPLYAGLCELAGCSLPSASAPEAISSSNVMLRPHPQRRNLLAVEMLVTNQAAFSQPYPLIEITLFNLNRAETARARFAPDQYLLDAAADALMPPGQPIRLTLLMNKPDTLIAGHEVAFYAVK